MLAGIRSRLTYANVMATIALFIALGGGAYALTLPKDSVKSKQIAPDAAKGVDIDEDTLDEVPSAQDAETLDGKVSGQFAPRGSEAWQPAPLNDGSSNDGLSTGNPGLHFGCYWTDEGAGHGAAAYFRDSAGVVHLRGVVQANDGNTNPCNNASVPAVVIFRLPVGYRPDARTINPTVSNNSPGRINVDSDGGVRIEGGYPDFNANAEQYVSLDDISFRCAPAGDGCP